MQYAEGIGNYLYILFAIGYMIYSFVKAGQKHRQNKPGSAPPPTASKPADDPIEEWKKILQDARKESQAKPAAQPPPKPSPAPVVQQKKKRVSLIREKRKAAAVRPSKTPSHVLVAEELVAEKLEAPEFHSHPELMKAFEESRSTNEDNNFEFDMKKAVIYSEILNRKEW